MRDMDASPAIMVLLMCSPASTDCLEIRSERIYETAALCREALPDVLARTNKADRKVTGRCAATENVPPGVDPIVTCSTGRRDATTTVRVTRVVEGQTVSDEWAVPKDEQRHCG